MMITSFAKARNYFTESTTEVAVLSGQGVKSGALPAQIKYPTEQRGGTKQGFADAARLLLAAAHAEASCSVLGKKGAAKEIRRQAIYRDAL